MPGFTIAELMATYRVVGATTAVRNMEDVMAAFDASGAAAERSAGQLSLNEKAMAAQAKAAAGSSTMTTKVRIAVLSATAAIARYNDALEKGNVPLARMASLEAGVVRTMQKVTDATTSAAAATDEFAAAQKTAAVESKGFASGAASMLKTVGGFAAFAGALEAAKAAIDVGKDASAFQRSMLLVQTQAGASSAQVKLLSKAVLNLAGPTATAPDELATSIYHIVSAGQGILSTAQDLKVLQIAAEGAKVGNASLEETTNALTATVTSGIKGSEDFAQAMGALNAIVGAGDMKLSDLNDALSTGLLANMKNFGLSLTDVGAALDVFGDNNIRGANGATFLRTAVTSLADPVKTGTATLKALGLSSTQLGEDMKNGGLNAALSDLYSRLKAAGKTSAITDLSSQIKAMKGHVDLTAVSASSLGQILTDGFGKKAGPGLAILVDQLARFQIKQKELTDGAQGFQSAWAATTQTVSFQFDELKASADAAGISFATKALPAASALAKVLLGTLTVGITTAGDALHPFVAGFKAIEPELREVATGLGDVAKFIEPLAPYLEKVGAATLGMWLAFKGYAIASAAVAAVRGEILGLSLAAKANLGAAGSSIRTWGAAWSGAGSEASLAARQTESDLAAIGASAAQAAADIDAAAAQDAEAYATMVAASDDASAHMIANSQNTAREAQEQADVSAGAAAEMAESAATAAAAVDAAGEAASLGWAGMLGPLAAVGLGVGLLTTLFHSNKSATQDTAKAQQSYADSLKQSSDLLAEVNTNATIKDLQDDKSISMLGQLHAANTAVGVSQTDLVLAVNGTSKAYSGLYDKLMQVAVANSTYTANGTKYNKTGQAAVNLAKNLTTLRTTLTATQKQQALVTTIQRQAQAAIDGGTTAAAKQAKALGLSSNAYLDAQAAAKQNTTQTNTQTAAFQAENDAASLLQQSLNGLAGINLSTASALTSVRSANLSVASSFKTNKTAIDGASQAAVNNQGAIQQQVQAAQQYAEAIGKQTDSSVKAKAAFAAQKQSLEDQLRATGNLTPAVQKYIDQLYNIANLKVPPTKLDADNAAALSKITALQARITAIKQGKVPDLDANSAEGRGVIKNLQAEIDALKGKTVPIHADTSQAMAALNALLAKIPSGYSYNVSKGESAHNAQYGHTGMTVHRATGGSIGDGPSGTVRGSGSPNVDSVPAMLAPGEEVIRTSQANKHRALLKAINAGTAGFKFGGTVPGYASGGIVHSGKNWIYNGIRYASDRAAQNAETSHLRSLAKAQASAQKSLLNTVGGDTRGVVGLADAGNVSSLTSKLTSLRTALSDAGVKSSWISKIAGDSTKLEQATSALSKASAALAAAKAVKATDVANTKAGITGSFDITSAGQDASTGAVTGGSILATSKQAVARAKAFYSGLSKLTDEKDLPADYIRAIAAKGPDDLPEVTALLSLPKASLHQLNLDNAALNSYGSALGNTVGSVLDNGAISKAQATLTLDEKTVAKDNKALAAEIVKGLLTVGWNTSVTVKGPDLVVAIKAAEKKQASTRGAVK